MATNTLTTRSTGETILDSFFNDFKSALGVDFVGRDSSGVPASGQNLGTVALPWGTVRAASLVLGGSTVDISQATAPPNRVVSGKKRTTSNQPAFITPNGAALSLIVAGATTNLVLDINSSSVSVTTDITKSSLTAAPSTNNTATVNDADAAGQADTRLWGEQDHRKTITMTAAGSEITALIGKYAAFNIGTEYFLAFIESATVLSKCFRGFFYNSSLAPKNREVFSNSATITLLKLGYVFVENNGTTVDVTYTNPTYSAESPSSPVTGDYWYDLVNNVWKRYDGASFISINRTLVGMFCNTTTACTGARCSDFYARYTSDNTMDVGIQTTEILRAKHSFQRINVAGESIEFGIQLPTWNITTDLASSADMYTATEQASTDYYAYVKDTGETILSDIEPYRRPDLLGFYHPHNPWRMVEVANNNASSNIARASWKFDDRKQSFFRAHKAGSQTPSGATVVTYASGDVTFDTDAGFDDSNDQWVCKKTGYYEIRSSANRGAGAANWVATGYRVNGGAFISSASACNATTGVSDWLADIVFLNAGDTVQHVFQTGADGVASFFYFMIKKLSVGINY